MNRYEGAARVWKYVAMLMAWRHSQHALFQWGKTRIHKREDFDVDISDLRYADDVSLPVFRSLDHEYVQSRTRVNVTSYDAYYDYYHYYY